MPHYHGKDLRKGRVSEPDRIYLVTAVTAVREPCFHDLFLGRILVEALRWCDQNELSETWCFVIMPDHLHWLLGLRGEARLSDLVRSVKRHTARQINVRRQRIGPVWQGGFHDHAIRRDESLRGVARYVVMNPVRAGLVRTLGEYPLWDAKWL